MRHEARSISAAALAIKGVAFAPWRSLLDSWHTHHRGPRLDSNKQKQKMFQESRGNIIKGDFLPLKAW